MRGWIFDIRSRPFVLLAAAAVAISLLVHFGATDALDRAAVSGAAAAPPWVGGIMVWITELGDAVSMLGFAIVVILLRRTRRIGITLMILLVITTLLTGYVKCGVDRDRPDSDYEPEFPLPISKDTFALFCQGSINASYPSGHAARTAVFAVVLGYALSGAFPRGCYLLLLYPAAVSASRIYLLEHYPMDVVGGAVIGLLLAGVLAKKTRLHTIFQPSKV